MVNTVRGESTVDVDGKEFTLCLTLGALAEMQKAVGAQNINDISKCLSEDNLSADDIINLIHILVKGGGHSDVTRKTIEAWPITVLDEAMNAIGNSFESAFGEKDNSQNPQ